MNITHAKNPPRLSISVDGSPITCVQQTKYLGVTILADLTWSKHIDHTCKSAKCRLGMIHRKFHQSSPQVRSKLYSSVILLKSEYCCSVWVPQQRKYMYKPDSVQRCACRLTTKDWSTDHETLSDRLTWFPLRTRRTHQKLILSYKIMNNISSIPSSHFIPHPSPSPRLPHNRPIFIPLAGQVPLLVLLTTAN